MGTLQRMIFSFANTDEIFAVASSQPGKIGKHYLYGLMLAPWIGWSLGTFLGAAAGTLLPAFVRSALGIAIYGMFLAIILPPARKSRPVRFVVLTAVALSLCFHYIPGLNTVSPGFVIIICGVAAAAAGAWRFPAEEDAA
jgi:predicted branched-subunit amino acid permease